MCGFKKKMFLLQMILFCHCFISELNFWSCGSILWMKEILALCWEITKVAVCSSWRKVTQPQRLEHSGTIWGWLNPWTQNPRIRRADCTTPFYALEGLEHLVYVGSWNYSPQIRRDNDIFKSFLPLLHETLTCPLLLSPNTIITSFSKAFSLFFSALSSWGSKGQVGHRVLSSRA